MPKRESPHHHADERPHLHGAVDPSVVATSRGIWAVKCSLAIMLLTGLLQLTVVSISGSVNGVINGVRLKD